LTPIGHSATPVSGGIEIRIPLIVLEVDLIQAGDDTVISAFFIPASPRYSAASKRRCRVCRADGIRHNVGPREIRSRHLRSALIGVCLAAAVLLGGAHFAVQVALTLGLLALLALRLASRGALARWRSLPSLLFVGLLATTLVQLLPLPAALIGVLSPGAADTYEMALGPDYGWAPLSQAPVATAAAVVPLLALLLASVLVAELVWKSRHRRQVVLGLAAAGTAVGAIGLGHSLAGVSRPFGSFGYASGAFTATFVNANHLGAFLTMGFALAGAVALFETGRLQTAGAVGALVCAWGAVATRSRGAWLALATAAAILAAGWLWSRRGARLAGLVATGAGAGLAAATWLARDALAAAAGDTARAAYNKADLWMSVPALLRDFPALGVGRGAFGHVFERYRAADLPYRTFEFLENEWLQTLIDWGPLAGITTVAVTAWLLVRVARRIPEEPLAVGAAGALAALGLHNLVDFNLQVLGVALPAAVLLASLGGPLRPPGRQRSGTPRWAPARGQKLWWAAGTAALLLLTAATAGSVVWSEEQDLQRLNALLTASPRNAIGSAAEPLLRRHPSDHLLPLTVARHLAQTGEPRQAMRWINRAMFLAPQSSYPHRLAARILWRLGARQQALLEYRLACEARISETGHIGGEVLARGATLEELSRLAGEVSGVRLRLAQMLIARGAPALVLKVLGPVDTLGTPREVGLAGSAMLRMGDRAGAHKVLKRLHQLPGGSKEYWWLRIQLAQDEGGDEAALREIDRATEAIGTTTRLLGERARRELALRRWSEAAASAESLLRHASSGRIRARGHSLLAQAFMGRNERALAIREMELARQQDLAEASYRLTIARWRRRIGDVAGARAELERARSEGVGDGVQIERALATLPTTEPSE
jgi:tetratricopeptide (TPR) repeat protein